MFRDVTLRRSFDFGSPVTAVYKPCGEFPPAQVNHLYSDATMLRLSLLPHISFELKQRALKYLPFQKQSQVNLPLELIIEAGHHIQRAATTANGSWNDPFLKPLNIL